MQVDLARQEVAAWREGLPADERVVADVAIRLHANFIRPKHFTGGCYLLAFFLRQYLRRKHHLDAKAVVGYVCDGTTPLRASHAWLEYAGKKTDVSLTITEFPEYQLPGELLVLDCVLQPGVAQYTYHHTQSPESLEELRQSSAAGPEFAAVIAMKEREHTDMLARAIDDDAMESFLADAPASVSYRALAAAIERR